MAEPASASQKQRGAPFRKGKSGNPAGRPQGSRNTATVILDALADGQATAVLQRVVNAAKAGDLKAAEIILSRVWPAKKGRPVRFDLPPTIADASDVLAALAAIVRATANGELTPEEATALANVLEIKRRAIETVQIEERLAQLEQHAAIRR